MMQMAAERQAVLALLRAGRYVPAVRARSFISAATLVSALVITRLVPGLCFSMLGVPAARLSAWWLGMPCEPVQNGLLLTNGTLPVAVTRACSGSDFFALVLAVLLPFAVAALPRRGWWTVVPLAAAVAILANACRIVAGWYTGVWARSALRATYWPGVHLATGIVVFLAALVGIHAAAMLAERRSRVEG